MNYLIFLTLYSSTAHKIVVPSEERQCSVFKQLTDEFYFHPIILYLDNLTKNDFKPGLHPLYIIKQDNILPSKRPTGYKFVHLIDSYAIILNADFLYIQTKISRFDIVIFIERNVTIPGDLLDKLFFVKMVFVVKVDVCITYHCVYNYNGKSYALKKIGKEAKLPQFTKSFKVLTKYMNEQNVGYTTMPPHVYYNKKSHKLRGTEIALLKMFSKIFKFKYKLINFDNMAGVDINPVEHLLSGVLNGTILWGAGAIIETENRMKLFENTRYVFIDAYMGIFKNFEKHNRETMFLFELNMLSTFSAICLYGLVYIHYKMFENKHLANYFWLIFLPLYDQSYPIRFLRKTSMRILFIIWWGMCIIIVISCKSYLFSTFLRKSYGLSTFEELVDEGYNFQIDTNTYVFIKDQCKIAPSEFCKKIVSRLSRHTDSCAALKSIFYNKTAIIGEHLTLKYLVYSECNLTKDQQNEADITGDRLYGAQLHFWPFAKNSIFAEPFSKILSIVEQSGINQRMLTRELGYSSVMTSSAKMMRTTKPTVLQDILVAFYILIFGYVIGGVAFLFEKLNERKNINWLP